MIVTGEASDDEMAARIERHRADRPWDWTVIEEPADLDSAMSALDDESLLIIDCLTLWVANLMTAGVNDEAIVERAARIAARAAARAAPVIAISNEVGSGIVPMASLGRRYRDVLGIVNSRWAQEAADTYLVVAGRVLRLEEASQMTSAGSVVW